ncbi:TPA: hypothetical protein IYE67_003004, partial [Enterococcus faecium]|nr:hypothetical protein [Enterococcus faecium]
TVRRHPHVFGADRADGVDDIVRLWSAAKAVEKSQRTSAYDGVPVGQPALARAQKLDARRASAGVARPAPDHAPTATSGTEDSVARAESSELAWGRALLAQVDDATDRGIDAERALRAAVRERETLLRRDEAGPAEVRPAEVGPAEVEPAGVGPAENGSSERGASESARIEQVPPQPE